jgi:hypothetical protein
MFHDENDDDDDDNLKTTTTTTIEMTIPFKQWFVAETTETIGNDDDDRNCVPLFVCLCVFWLVWLVCSLEISLHSALEFSRCVVPCRREERDGNARARLKKTAQRDGRAVVENG